MSQLSDEFLRVAAQEINEELSHIDSLVKQCNTDSDVSNFCDNLKGHFHKIKGLAPMMGKKRVGNVAETLDVVLKQIIAGKKVIGIKYSLNDSVDFMMREMKEDAPGYEKLESTLKKLSSNL